MAKKIGLDAGHGLKTAGKQTPDGIKEWTLNDKVRDKVVSILSDYDVEIIHTDNDEGQTDESLSYRLNKYLNAGVDVFVSIHHNAYNSKWNNVTGVEVFTDKNATDEDTRLANCIYSRLPKYTGLKGRGIKKENWYVINQNKIPAVLVEGGFMDGTNDYKIITSDAGQTAYAKAVVEGLIEFLGLKKKTSSSTSNSTSTTTSELYRVRKTWADTSSQIGAYSNLDNAKAACKEGYSVFDSKGNVVYSVASAPVSHKYTIGQHVQFGTSYPSPTLPCGYEHATSGHGHGIITAIVQGQAKYQIDNGKHYCNDGDMIGLYSEPKAHYYPKYTGTSSSLVDALNSLKIKSSFSNRAKIAQKNSIANYKGTSQQNGKLLSLLKAGKLIR